MITAAAGTDEGLECTETQSSCLQCYCNALLFAAPISDLYFCPNQLAKVVRVLGVNLSLTTVTTILNLFLQVRSIVLYGRLVLVLSGISFW